MTVRKLGLALSIILLFGIASAQASLASAPTPNRNGMCEFIGDSCQYGDIGPGGGKIFITPETVGNNTGKYFEVQSETTDSFKFCTDASIPFPNATGNEIGSGSPNTAAIEASGCDANSAIGYVQNFDSHGYLDWFLPSVTETSEIFNHMEFYSSNVFTSC